MRTQRLIDGFNNSQKIRVIVDNVGFYTTVGGTQDMCTRAHRMAVQIALQNLAYDRAMAKVRYAKDMPVGFGFNYNYYENPNRIGGTPDKVIGVQVDLV